jgi:hypothetical protein
MLCDEVASFILVVFQSGHFGRVRLTVSQKVLRKKSGKNEKEIQRFSRMAQTLTFPTTISSLSMLRVHCTPTTYKNESDRPDAR